MHAPPGRGLVYGVKDKARADHPFTLFFSDHIRLRGIYDCHRLEIEHSLPFGFDCFRNLRLLFGRKVVPRYLVGVPTTKIKLSMQWARLGRRNRKGSVFLAFSDVEASSLLPCLLDDHRSFSFCRHPSSVSVTLHHHSVVLRRSFLGHAHVESLSSCLQQLHSPGGAWTSLLRRNEKEQRIHWSRLVLVFSHAVPQSTPGPRMRPDGLGVSLSLLEIEPCDHRLQSPCQCRLKSRRRPRAPRGFLIWHCVIWRRDCLPQLLAHRPQDPPLH